MTTHPSVVFPIQMRRHPLDLVAATMHVVCGRCLVCGRVRPMRIAGSNLRESVTCTRCRAFNRQRQIAYVVCRSDLAGISAQSLVQFAKRANVDLYNTESVGALHATLKGMRGYRSSEFVSPNRQPGSVVEGIQHEDLQQLSFRDDSFDLVISSEVLELVPDAYRAHSEVYRVLRPGGRHVFTALFQSGEHDDLVRAVLDEERQVPVLLRPAEYHMDTIRPEGALVYRTFGLETLFRLRQLGFKTRLYHLYRPWNGILGPNAFVFEAAK